jgi:hypothetical protein
MRNRLLFMVALVSASILSAALSGSVTPLSVLAQFIMFGALFGPMYLAPRRYAQWTARCRLPGFRRPAWPDTSRTEAIDPAHDPSPGARA